MKPATLTIGSYELLLDRSYDPETHLWVKAVEGTTYQVGFDPLGAETSGDIVAISIEPPGTRVARGRAFGSLEAAKFVGPLIAPVSGVIGRHNDRIATHPGLVNSEPLDSWLMEIAVDDWTAEQGHLSSDPAKLRPWFEEAIASFKQKGMVAE